MSPSPSAAPTEPSPKPRLLLPWRTRLSVSLISLVSDAARRPDGTINRRLLNLFDFKASPSPSKPFHSVISADVTVDSARKLWFRLYTPTNTFDASLPIFIFFHGGGFSYLSPASRPYDTVCRRFARAIPAFVVSVNYRLTPEHRFPCQYDDGFDVLRFLDDEKNAALLPSNADLSKCFLAGDSAGANLAHHVAVRACRTRFRALKVAGLVSIQPFFGGEERRQSEIVLAGYPLVSVTRTDWLWKAFLPRGSDRDHYAVNVSGPNAEDISGLHSFPDTVVFVGGLDPLQDWQRRYYEWLKDAGKGVRLMEYPNGIHAFYIFPELPESSQLLGEVKEFVGKCLSTP